MPVLERAGQTTAVIDAVTRARGGVGSLLLVAGEAGVGKTTLVRTALDELPAGVGRWWGACDPLATPRPLGPWEDMAAREPALASVLHDTDRIAMGAGVLELLREPTVVVVEDFHWVDEATVDLLLYLGRRLQRCRSVILLTYRPVDVTTDGPASRLLGLLARSPEAQLLRVDPLSQEAVARLADGSGLDPGLLHRRTGGNPFYVTEVLADPAGTVPGTVAGAVRARLGELPSAGRALLEVVALAPSGLEYPVAAELLGEDPAETGLDQVAVRGMAGLDGGRITFRHELARLAVAEAVPPGRRRRLHLALLDTLEATPGIDPARLVHHAAQTQDRKRILTHAPAAADAAEARGAFRAAAAHLERAIAAADDRPAREQAQLWERLTLCREHFDEPARVVALREQVIDRWRELGDADHAVAQLCFVVGDHHMIGDWAAAEQALSRASELLSDTSDPAVDLQVRVYWMKLNGNRLPPAERLSAWERLSADASAPGMEKWRHAAWEEQARLRALLGDVDQALRLAQSCATLARRTVQDLIGKAELNVGESLLECRQHEPAERLLQVAMQASLDRDGPSAAEYAAALLARLHLERGRWVAARAAVARAGPSELVLPVAQALLLAVLARLDAHEGVSDPESNLDTAWQRVLTMDDHDFVWPVAVAVAEAAWVQGDPATAADTVLPALDVARATEHPWAVGELTWWARQAGHDVPVEIEVAEPWAAALAGDWAAAADAWATLGCPLDEAIALTAGDLAARRRALDLFLELGATADADRLRQQLRAAGVTDLPARDRPRADPDTVTARQLEVLELVAAGHTNAAIAQRLFISEKTVGHHVSAILQRLDVRTRTHAVAVARQRGLLPD